MKAKHKPLKILIAVFCALILCGALVFGAINGIVIGKAKPYILSETDCAELEDADCILVLGCAVWEHRASLQHPKRKTVESPLIMRISDSLSKLKKQSKLCLTTYLTTYTTTIK